MRPSLVSQDVCVCVCVWGGGGVCDRACACLCAFIQTAFFFLFILASYLDLPRDRHMFRAMKLQEAKRFVSSFLCIFLHPHACKRACALIVIFSPLFTSWSIVLAITTSSSTLPPPLSKQTSSPKNSARRWARSWAPYLNQKSLNSKWLS